MGWLDHMEAEAARSRGRQARAFYDGADMGRRGASIRRKTGDANAKTTQSASAHSGDAIGGQVTGVVTAPGGNVDLVLANHSEDIQATTGDAESNNLGLSVSLIVVI
jgi:hypothetical protein